MPDDPDQMAAGGGGQLRGELVLLLLEPGELHLHQFVEFQGVIKALDEAAAKEFKYGQDEDMEEVKDVE